MKSLHELVVELEAWLEHLWKHPEVQASVAAQSAAAEVAPSVVAEAPPVPAPVEDGSDFTRRMLQAEYDSKPHEAAAITVAVVPALDFTDSVLDFNAVAGQNIPVTGSATKKFTGCPAVVWVQTINGSGSTLVANGVTRAEPNGQALNRLAVSSVGGVVDVEVTCNTTTDLTVLRGPD